MSELKQRMEEVKLATRLVKALRNLSEESWRRVLDMVRGELESKS